MGATRSIPIATGTVELFFSDRSDGDFQIREPAPDVEQRRRAVIDAPWTWIHQVHGDRVLDVTGPGDRAGEEADGLLTTAVRTPVAVTTADCAPIVLVADRGVAVVHAGWRGLHLGIVEKAGNRLRELAGDPVTAVVGPCIHPGDYEFGEDELSMLAERYGPSVRSETRWGTPALDMPAACTAACRGAGWEVIDIGPCTSGDEFYSHRTRADRARLTAVAWIEP